MQALSRSSRIWFAFVFLTFSAWFSWASAQDVPAAATPWQDVISSQIQAFRDHDAPAALSFAGQGFQATFPSPESFFVTIMSSGYAPIMESRSHSFGSFQKVGDKSVAQLVKLLDKDQKFFEAVYLMTEEPAGWRVQGVQLAKTGAVGI